ncbi:hypothetical protein L810_6343 [Burkholderia sp. AU4i]|nr:hypothetical protein L810_6343 [Burkholderia sp. AU4i]
MHHLQDNFAAARLDRIGQLTPASAETAQRLRKTYTVDAALFFEVTDKSKHRLPDSIHPRR